MPIVFAAISPHPPIILPSVGSEEDRLKVKNTTQALENLGKKFSSLKTDYLIISSPHPDWGFNVPLFFIAKKFSGEIKKILIGLEPPEFYFEKGKKLASKLLPDKKYAFIASGDTSHCLKEDGPYGFHPDGPKFDKALIEAFNKKGVETILKLDELYPDAAECGLRSFCFLFGILEGAKINWQTEILSYESPFGVGYLAAGFKFKPVNKMIDPRLLK